MWPNCGSSAAQLLLIVLLTLIQSLKCQDFGYDGSEGPSHWGDKYQQCFGKHQSPVDIDDHKVEIVQLPKLRFHNFNKLIPSVKLLNNGHTVKLSINDAVTPTIHGGPLNGTYVFDHLHFHWGPNDTIGSENKVNNLSFPLELHMLFYNKIYQNSQEASKYPDGYCVLSFLYSAQDSPCNHFVQFQRALGKIKTVLTSTNITHFGSLDKFTQIDRHRYFTYQGSLTTPPCSEVVTWIEFREFIKIGHDQLEAFRNLQGAHGEKLDHNYRPTQNIGDRIIYYNSSETIQGCFLVVLLTIWVHLGLY